MTQTRNTHTHTHAHFYVDLYALLLLLLCIHHTGRPYWIDNVLLKIRCQLKSTMSVQESEKAMSAKKVEIKAWLLADGKTLCTFAPGNGKILGFSSKRFGAMPWETETPSKGSFFRGCLSLPVVGGVKSWLSTTAYLTKILVNWVETTNNHKMQEVRGGV